MLGEYDFTKKVTVLTGDRPTGALHLGHYAGSIRERVRLQDTGAECFVMVADAQAYTDNIDDTRKVGEAIPQVVADYIGCGIDPDRTTVFLQSAIPELAELTLLYMNMTTVSRLERNPTISAEKKLRGYGEFERDFPSGFLCYPVAQAADITGFKATHVPVGEDQLPMIELAQETARKVNRAAARDVLPEPLAVLSTTGRLPGIDGKAKASKSLGNAIHLLDTDAEIERKVMLMFTDPDHLTVAQPGKVEGNVVFSYLDAFHADKEEVSVLKDHYRRGGLGDVKLKRLLANTLVDLVRPIRERREEAISDSARIEDILRKGSAAARERVAAVIDEVRNGLGVFRLR
ncbi:tryptophan--tRNA ligase [Pararhizobium sp. BT-229]|uniref:tryptophan--tRNA ligase n=1 Tax=Pararhizobium sp. BT-229 TaxID=2986923 RepID=UPI0021F7607B|nr:tryptophan--tRNA ligase [Pararhizobium sp. BT-229]MCV9963695.1 tryptophan--tRNA ligase [Pararhizobium sp. BT-229]